MAAKHVLNKCTNGFNSSYRFIEYAPKQYRYLTPRECWRLQGFRDEHYNAAAQVNGKTALYKQAGNSMPIPVLEAIFEPLVGHL